MKPKLICTSSQFITDRVLLHSSFLATAAQHFEPVVMSQAVRENSFPKTNPNAAYFEPQPLPQGFPTYITMLRRFENFAWDHKQLTFSRGSMWRLIRQYKISARDRYLYQTAAAVTYLGLESWLEKQIEKILVAHSHRDAIYSWLRQQQAALTLIMNPFLESHQVVAGAARKLKLPLVAYITSWDNITTKPRMVFDYDAYLVWSESMKQELLRVYPTSRRRPIYITGAPPYDVFCQPQHEQSRKDFCARYKLDEQRPIIVYSLGSPNFIREDYGLIPFLTAQASHPELQHAQVIVRPHPGFLDTAATELERVQKEFPNVVLQSANRHWQKVPFQGEASTHEWVNTVRHCDVLINTASTMAVDASYFDRPVVNINYDPQPGMPNQQLVNELNSRWDHYRPLTESGGMWEVNNLAELLQATATYLKQPELHREGRRWMVKHVFGQVDGRSGQRMAEALGDFWASRQ